MLAPSSVEPTDSTGKGEVPQDWPRLGFTPFGPWAFEVLGELGDGPHHADGITHWSGEGAVPALFHFPLTWYGGTEPTDREALYEWYDGDPRRTVGYRTLQGAFPEWVPPLEHLDSCWHVLDVLGTVVGLVRRRAHNDETERDCLDRLIREGVG